MFITILAAIEGVEKVIPLGLVAAQEIQKLIALLKPAPNADGTVPTQAETLAAVEGTAEDRGDADRPDQPDR